MQFVFLLFQAKTLMNKAAVCYLYTLIGHNAIEQYVYVSTDVYTFNVYILIFCFLSVDRQLLKRSLA